MDSIYLGISVVLPLVIYMGIGMWIREIGWVSERTLTELNKVTFRVFMFALLFMNTYAVDIWSVFSAENIKILVISIVSLVIIFIMAGFICSKKTADKQARAIIIQSMYRSNVALFGLPVSMAVYGDENLSGISLLIAIVVPVYNITSSILLARAGKEQTSAAKIARNVVTNPLVLGAFLGMFCSLVRFRMPELLLTPVEALAKTATPLAFVVLGGSLVLQNVRDHMKILLSVSFIRLLIVPALVLGTAVFTGIRNHELVALTGLFGAPVAVASYTMAKELDVKAELAGELVAVTTLLSVITMFGWIAGLRACGLI